MVSTFIFLCKFMQVRKQWQCSYLIPLDLQFAVLSTLLFLFWNLHAFTNYSSVYVQYVSTSHLSYLPTQISSWIMAYKPWLARIETPPVWLVVIYTGLPRYWLYSMQNIIGFYLTFVKFWSKCTLCWRGCCKFCVLLFTGFWISVMMREFTQCLVCCDANEY